MSNREPMSSVDTAWLRMDRPTNHMMILIVMMFEDKIALYDLRELMVQRFLRHGRFHDRVVMEGGSAYWERDPDFDLSFHLRQAALPSPAGQAELQELVSDLASSPLDPAHPLWQFHLVDDYEGGSALVVRIHHCYADGIALVHVLLSMADSGKTWVAPPPPCDGLPQSAGPARFAPLTRAVGGAYELGVKLATGYFDLLLHPLHALDYAREGVDLAGEAARLATMPLDSPTRFKGVPHGVKRAAWSSPTSLQAVKSVAHALDCSVNDVLLSCIAGALRTYLLSRGDEVNGTELRALIPVNLRPPEDNSVFGNYFGLVALLLPLYLENPLARLYEIKARMDVLKSSRQAALVLALLGAAGAVPNTVQQQVLDTLANRASAVMTNLPGPQQPIYLAGAKLREIMFWVPQSGNIGMGLSVLSYNDGVQFGMITDKKLVADPEDIVARFAEQLDQLLLITLLFGPWDAPPDPKSIEQALDAYSMSPNRSDRPRRRRA